MLVFDINWLAVVIGFLFSDFLALFWYSAKTPIGAFYMREMNYDPVNLDKNYFHFGLDFVSRFFLIIGFGLVFSWSNVDNLVDGLILGLMIWFFFLLTSHFGPVVYEKRKITVYGIYVAYQLVVFLVIGLLFVLI